MKKDKKNILDTLKRILKKQAKTEKEKRTKKKNIKKNKPRGFTARRTGAIIFWILFIFMFTVVFVTMFGSSSTSESDEGEFTNTKVGSYEAVEYSKNFVFDLFNTTEDSEIRNAKIKSYVPNSLNISEALYFDKGVSVEVDKDDIILYELVETTNEKARHIYSVKLKTKTQLSEMEEKEYAENKDEYLNILMQDDEAIIGIKNNEIIREIEIHLVIPIAYSEGSFVIFDYPSYTFIETTDDKSVESLLDMLENETDTEIEENVGAFLNVFFKSFATDSTDQLSYILNDEHYKNGLANSLTFNSVKDFSLYKGKDEDMVVDVTVVFTQDKTGFNVTSNYVLVIAQKEERYVVNHVNDDQYLYELIHGEQPEEISEDEEVNETNNNSNADKDEKEELLNLTPNESFQKLIESVNTKDIDTFKKRVNKEDGTPLFSALNSKFVVLKKSLDKEMELTDELNLVDIPEKTLAELGLSINELQDKVYVVEDLLWYSLLSELLELFKVEPDVNNYEVNTVDGSNETIYSIKRELIDKEKQIEIEYKLHFIEIESNWQLSNYESNETVLEKEEPKKNEKTNKDKKDDKKEDTTKA